MAHLFDRSGLASQDDLEHAEWRELYEELAREQESFLAREDQFRSADYPWPRDALHTWSRIWEYPYLFHHLRSWGRARNTGQPPVIADLGCGVTFVPFALQRELGARVLCIDNDPLVGKDLLEAVEAHGIPEGEIEFVLVEGTKLPMEDASVDALYCISVLEHIPNPARYVSEIHRVLRPGGLLVVTIDVELIGREDACGINPEDHKKLVESLLRHFDYRFGERAPHPNRMLLSDEGPYRAGKGKSAFKVWSRKMRGKPTRELRLTCQSFVMTRRDSPEPTASA